MRTKIPTGRAEVILFESDMSCCICRVPGKSLQLHHLNGDPNNHDSTNIAVLCHDHHSQATSTPGLGRGLSEGVIRRYRDEWLAMVRTRRRLPTPSRRTLQDRRVLYEMMLEALACHEIRKVRHALRLEEWDQSVELLRSLYVFTDWSYGYEVRSEILYTLAIMGDQTRRKMPVKVAREIEDLALAALPIASLVMPSRRRPNRKVQELLRSALDLGFAIAYDGVKYLRDIAVTAAGTRILFIVLRFAHLNSLSKLKSEVLEEFARLQEEADRVDFQDARHWLEFEKLDALALDGDPLPYYPEELEAKILAKS